MMKDPEFNLTLGDFEYFDANIISGLISEYMQNTSFTGISVSTLKVAIFFTFTTLQGDVSFDINGTRNGLNAIYQLGTIM